MVDDFQKESAGGYQPMMLSRRKSVFRGTSSENQGWIVCTVLYTLFVLPEFTVTMKDYGGHGY